MSEQAGSSRIRVLLIEDNLDHAFLIRNAIPEADGFELVHVRTAADGAEQAGRGKFDICLVDHRLPDGEGARILGELARRTGAPVVLITTVGREGLAKQAVEQGAADYLVKGPGFFDSLADVIRARVGGGAS